ncbi:MAG: hypothetical protein ABJO67_18335 [Pseudoruegeria sp.]
MPITKLLPILAIAFVAALLTVVLASTVTDGLGSPQLFAGLGVLALVVRLILFRKQKTNGDD